MRFMLISDNHDTAVGMRLVGIDGVIVSTREEVEEKLQTYMKCADIGIILITELIYELCTETIDDMKLHNKQPLIVVIPDRHAEGSKDSIMRYIREAIGVKF